MTYLVFSTFNDAYIANAVISMNMRLAGDITVQYALPQRRFDEKYVLPKPNGHMEYVTNFIEEEYQEGWFLQ